MKTILLFGSSGFIGKNLLHFLKKENYKIYNPSSKNVNLLNFNSLDKYLRKLPKIDIIINSAAKIGGLGYMIAEPEKIFIENSQIIESSNNFYSLITVDITNIFIISDFDSDGIATIDISYIVKDNANNINTVSRPIKVEQAFLSPKFYYNLNNQSIFVDSTNVPALNLKIGSNLTDTIIRQNIIALDIADNLNNITNNITYSIRSDLININNGQEYTEITNENIHVLNNLSTSIIVTYNDAIKYKVISTKEGINATNFTLLERNIEIVQDDELIKIIHCCYPKVYYKSIQHNSKLGASACNAMRLSKIIINNRNF